MVKRNKNTAEDLFREHQPGEPEVLGADGAGSGEVPQEALEASSKLRKATPKLVKKDTDLEDPYSEDLVCKEHLSEKQES